MVRDGLESPRVRGGVIEWGEYSPWDAVKNAVSSEGERRKVFQDGKAMLGTKVLRILLSGTLGTIAWHIHLFYLHFNSSCYQCYNKDCYIHKTFCSKTCGELRDGFIKKGVATPISLSTALTALYRETEHPGL